MNNPLSNKYMERVRSALQKSWKHDRIAFMNEMFGTVFTIAGAITLAVTADEPNMKIIYPMYQIGTIALMYAYYRREMIWSIGLTAFFIATNFIGFYQAFA